MDLLETLDLLKTWICSRPGSALDFESQSRFNQNICIKL